MNYEQKYKEALEKATKLHSETEYVCEMEMLEQIFPELKESEDEKIRKELINFFSKGAECDSSTNGIKDRNIIAWLEKQGEQKQPIEYTLEQSARIFLDALSNTPYNNKPVTDAQVITRELLNFLSDVNSYNPNAINEQKPWSEEDEKMLEDTISCLSAYQSPDISKGLCYQEQIDWLKSLKPNNWKPSEEQIEILDMVLSNESMDDNVARILRGLKEQIEKL